LAKRREHRVVVSSPVSVTGVASKGTVVTSHPGIGVGVKFTSIGEDSRKVLMELLDSLSAQRRRGLSHRAGANG
jgi:hypothetical protein